MQCYWVFYGQVQWSKIISQKGLEGEEGQILPAREPQQVCHQARKIIQHPLFPSNNTTPFLRDPPLASAGFPSLCPSTACSACDPPKSWSFKHLKRHHLAQFLNLLISNPDLVIFEVVCRSASSGPILRVDILARLYDLILSF